MTSTSYWLEDVEAGPTRPPLRGDASADVVVVGGGFTGLWTAWYLLDRDPGLDVVVLEAEHVGFGASGRNGAWCSPNLGVGVNELTNRSSPAVARRTVQVMRDSVSEVAEAARGAGLDIDFRKGGILRIARGPHELPAMRSAYDALDRIEAAGDCVLLDAAELQDRVRVDGALGAFHDPYGAVLHPGKLVQGLAEASEARGARVFERSAVVEVEPRSSRGRPRADTADGSVSAEVVVLGTEAWLSQLPGHERDVLPVYSLVVLTEPITSSLWDEIGWERHECLSSHRYVVDYLSRTVDGRILFGGRGAPYHFGSAIEPEFDHHAPTHDALSEHLVDWFPMLEGVAISHRWGGPLGMPRGWLPAMWLDRGAGIAAAYGYTGQGVATTNLAGRVLAELIVDGETEFADLPMVGHTPRKWEPEPVRWIAARYLQWSLGRIDQRAAETGRPPTGKTLAERLVRH